MNKFIEDLVTALVSKGTGVNIIVVAPPEDTEEKEEKPDDILSEFQDFEGIFGGGGSDNPSESHLFGAADGGAFTF